MNSTVRWVLVVAGVAGVVFSLFGFIDMIGVFRTNAVTDGQPVGLREHYLQLGHFYTRGFTTGFFFCFSLMLVAIAVGTLYDERRRMRRRAEARERLGPGEISDAGVSVPVLIHSRTEPPPS